MNNINIEEVRILYEQEQMSVPAIAIRLNCSQWMLYKYMKKYNIVRRDRAASRRAMFMSSPLSFSPKEDLNPSEQQLKNIALALYWAEGSKRTSHTVDLANSDPEIIQIFALCLRKIYGVTEARLRGFLYCYANQPVEQLVEFWSDITNIPVDQFTKPYVRNDFSEKHRTMPYGLIHIRYSDQRLFELIMQDIRKMIETLPGYPSGQRGLTVNGSLSSKDELQSGRIAGKLRSVITE